MNDNTDFSASGRRRSGEARMATLTDEEKKRFSAKGVASRWTAPAGVTVYEPEAWGELPIVGHAVPCAVLVVENEVIRLVSERGLIKSLGGKRGGSHWLRAKESDAAANLPPILSAANLRPCISQELIDGLKSRYYYKIPGRSGMVANGVRAELYPMICDVYLKAKEDDLILPAQEEIASAAYILMRALAHTGIIALVDEATGFQSIRPPDALTRILEAFIAKSFNLTSARSRLISTSTYLSCADSIIRRHTSTGLNISGRLQTT